VSDRDIDVQSGIEYANHDGVALLGDLYKPTAPGVYPTLLLIHGGGWSRTSRANHRFWGPYLAERGYVAFSADYRLATNDRPTYPQNVHDLKAAVQYLRGSGAVINVDADRIGVMGESAGGHLAALLALSGDSRKLANPYSGDPHYGVSTRLKVAVPIYAVSYLDEVGHMREVLESRFDDLKTGRVTAIDGDVALAQLRSKPSLKHRGTRNVSSARASPAGSHVSAALILTGVSLPDRVRAG
jgi:acetyl esterase/lipase